MKRNKLLLVSLIIGVIYLIYSAWYWSGANAGSGSDAAQAGAALATALVMPHLAMTVIAVILNAIAYFANKSGLALAAAILYTVALVLFVGYFMFVVVEMVLCYVAFAQMHKEPKDAEA